MRLNKWNLSAAAFAVSLAGCSGEGSTVSLAPVTGVVTLDGKSIDGATVVFSPKGQAPLSTAITDLSGKFEMKTGSGRPGAAVGDHSIAVIMSMTTGGTPAPKTPDNLAPLMASEAAPGQIVQKSIPPRTVWVVPEKYSKPETSGLTVNVPSGGLADYKLELKK